MAQLELARDLADYIVDCTSVSVYIVIRMIRSSIYTSVLPSISINDVLLLQRFVAIDQLLD